MGENKVRLEVSLVKRCELDKIDGAFDADVTRAWVEDKSKWLTVMVPYHLGGIAMLTVTLDDYIIKSVTLYDGTYTQGYTEAYGPSEHEQIQAFECLENICEEEEVVSSIGRLKEEDTELSGLVGPKRLEITLRSHGSTVERKLVVTDLMPPTGHYRYYSVSGREWKVYQKKLDRLNTTLWGSSAWLSRIDAYLAGGEGSCTEHFTPQNQEEAWGLLEKMFYKFKPAEITVLKNWTIDEAGDDDDDWGYGGVFYGPTHGGQHWTNRSPAAYAPKEAHFRVAGDEVGAVIHREQKKIWEESGSPSPQDTLQAILEPKIEKKDEAGDDDDASGNSSSTTDDSCSECGGDDCHPAYCVQDFGIAAFGPAIPVDGGYTVH